MTNRVTRLGLILGGVVCAAALGSGAAPDTPQDVLRAAQGLAISPVPIDVSKLSAEDARRVGIGSYIVNAAASCGSCHSSPAGFLAGGNPFALDATHTVWSRNLTPDAATGLPLTEWQFLHALRTGRDIHYADSKMLVVMPWLVYRWMSEADIKAVYAYLRLIPAVSNAVPRDTKSDLPLPPAVPFPGFYTDGEVKSDLHDNGSHFPFLRGENVAARALPPGLQDGTEASVGTGAYLVNAVVGCTDCHTNPARTADNRQISVASFLAGGTVFGVPPPLQPVFHQVRTQSANLVGARHGFFNESTDSWQRFHDVIHTGTHVDETPPRPLAFPMNEFARSLSSLLDDDLHAIYDYVKVLPAVTGDADAQRQQYARFCTAAADCGSGETCAAATHECVGHSCKADLDCDVCQTCSAGGACVAPAADSACVAGAH